MYYTQPTAGAYAATETALLSPKRAEARAITGLTRRMIDAYEGRGTSFATKAALLHENRRLWHAIMLTVADEANEMPDVLRAGLLNLGGVVDRSTDALLRGRGDVSILLEINRRIVAGLSTEAA